MNRETIKVLGEICNDSSIQKAYKFLKVSDKCFCIEGVFCEAALRLGYKGSWIRDKNNFTFIDEDGGGSFTVAPASVYEFLGIPDFVEYEPAEFLMWWGLNDLTGLSLAEIFNTYLNQNQLASTEG